MKFPAAPVIPTQASVEIPEKLKNRKLRSERQRVKYTNEYLLAVIPQVANEFIQALVRGLHQNNPHIIRMAGEMVGMVQVKQGLNVNLQQTNSTTNQTLSIGEKAEKVSFDQIIRQRAEEKKRISGAPMVTVDTTAEQS